MEKNVKLDGAETAAGLFKESLDLSRQKALMEALWSGEEETASRMMSDLLWETISYMDYHENYYHAFLAGLFAGRGYVRCPPYNRVNEYVDSKKWGA